MTPRAFAKYEAAENDFIVVEDLDDERAIAAAEAAALCERRSGVGADGVVRITRSDAAAFAMELRNADGSLAEMSGNGIRCLAAYALDRGLTAETTFAVATASGVRRVAVTSADGEVSEATVEMGRAAFERDRVPMRGEVGETFLDQPWSLPDGTPARASAVSMGNPHLVLEIDGDPVDLDVGAFGPELEHHASFPQRTNVELTRVTPAGIDVRVWERGVGETRACGTGACAVLAVLHAAGRAPAAADVRFPGGTLRVELREDGALTLSGPVRHVFDGSVALGAR